MTEKMLLKKYDDPDIVATIMSQKRSQEGCVKAHPEVASLEMYWCWDASVETVDTEEISEMGLRAEAVVDNEQATALANLMGLTAVQKGKPKPKARPKAAPEDVARQKQMLEAKAVLRKAASKITECKAWPNKLSTCVEEFREVIKKQMKALEAKLESVRLGCVARLSRFVDPYSE